MPMMGGHSENDVGRATSQADTRTPSQNGHARRPSTSSRRGSDGVSTTRSPSRPASRAAFSDRSILPLIIDHIYADLIALGRETRQARLASLATVAKPWRDPVHARLYRNPYLGTGERAGDLEAALGASPRNAELVKKLIFGEGSSMDITDWPTPKTPNNILQMAENVECVGFDGLHTIDLQGFGKALTGANILREIRACDQMPMPWCTIPYFFDNIIHPLTHLTRIRLYGLHTQMPRDDGENSPESRHHPSTQIRPFQAVPLLAPMPHPFVSVSLNHCAIPGAQMMRIFEGASESLTSLTLEHHGELTVQDLLCLLKLVGKNLKILEIEGFLDSALEKEEHLALEGVSNHIAQSALTQQKEIETTIDTILEYCPRLKTLDFLEGLASEETPKRLARDGANVPLESWRFTCNERVSPQVWIEAFQSPHFPKSARCRVQASDAWSAADNGRVRTAAWRYAGLSWMSADEEGTLDIDDGY